MFKTDKKSFMCSGNSCLMQLWLYLPSGSSGRPPSFHNPLILFSVTDIQLIVRISRILPHCHTEVAYLAFENGGSSRKKKAHDKFHWEPYGRQTEENSLLREDVLTKMSYLIWRQRSKHIWFMFEACQTHTSSLMFPHRLICICIQV